MARPCSVCTLSPHLRAEVEALAQRGTPVRAISRIVEEHGQRALPDAIDRHLKNHVGKPTTATDEPTLQKVGGSSSMTVAVLSADALRKNPYTANELARLLRREGLIHEADVVLAAVPESMRTALEAAAGSEGTELLEARALASATGRVFASGYPDAARAIADVLDKLGVVELADEYRALANTVQAA